MQLRTTVPLGLAAALVVAGCNKKSDSGGPGSAGSAGSAAAAATVPDAQELPAPPKDAFIGDARVVNLYRDTAGTNHTIDVWGRRSFKYGPIKLASNLPYGAASGWFGIPEGTRTVLLPAGAGPDDERELGGVFAPTAGEQATVLFLAKDGEPASFQLQDSPPGRMNAPERPPAGKGLVVLHPEALMDHDEALRPTYGGRSFDVGDGAGNCARTRVEDKGFQRPVLGGTQYLELDLPPGTATFTFHRWPAPAGIKDNCKTPPVFELQVEVVADQGTAVFLHTPDGQKLAALQIPLWK
jgi:hypothetical protein